MRLQTIIGITALSVGTRTIAAQQPLAEKDYVLKRYPQASWATKNNTPILDSATQIRKNYGTLIGYTYDSVTIIYQQCTTTPPKDPIAIIVPERKTFYAVENGRVTKANPYNVPARAPLAQPCPPKQNIHNAFE
jgi:hypothetical protein